MTERRIAQDGYSRRELLQEGYIRKGGQNEPQSQVQVRPAAPAPMRPAQSSSQGNSNPGNGTTQSSNG